ncbi:hypothetical protein J8803_29670, partial [Klebsiella pneumoniae]
VMFFRTVFGFSLEHEQTLPDPYGLVRSLAVRSPQGDIRLALKLPDVQLSAKARQQIVIIIGRDRQRMAGNLGKLVAGGRQ